MCLICETFKSGKLTSQEAMDNLDEMSDKLDPEHVRDIIAMVVEDEINNSQEYDEYEDIESYLDALDELALWDYSGDII